MTVMEAINGRKSIRKFEDRPVEAEKLRHILEAGRLAPMARRSNCTAQLLVQDPALISQLTEACMGQQFIGTAPAVLVVCSNTPYGDMPCQQRTSTVDASIALSFIMLAAYEQGLGTCWMGGFTQEGVRKVLGIPEEYDIVALTPIGYPAEEGAVRQRKPLEEMTYVDHWQPYQQ